jgi:GT2 family glycosyltransferase
VPPQKPEKIAAALLRLCGDADLRSKIGAGGFQTVHNNYTWEHTVDCLQQALSEGMDCLGLNKHSVPSKLKVSDRDAVIFETVPGDDNLDDSNPPNADSYQVSAIVSTYNSERFIRGCIEDLLEQTIADQLQIIVVDSGSQQNEEAVVREFQKKFRNIKYIKTDCRESVYAAWNRGILAAVGKYITNANTDDRHAQNAFERMAEILDKKQDISLVYADLWITETENETFDKFTPAGRFNWQDFDSRTLINGCYIGPQPMWRKSVHDAHGYFDEKFESAGDWEFWLRISKTEKFLHIKEYLGLYLKSPTSIEHRDNQLSRREIQKIRRIYANTQPSHQGAGITPASM